MTMRMIMNLNLFRGLLALFAAVTVASTPAAAQPQQAKIFFNLVGLNGDQITASIADLSYGPFNSEVQRADFWR